MLHPLPKWVCKHLFKAINFEYSYWIFMITVLSVLSEILMSKGCSCHICKYGTNQYQYWGVERNNEWLLLPTNSSQVCTNTSNNNNCAIGRFIVSGKVETGNPSCWYLQFIWNNKIMLIWYFPLCWNSECYQVLVLGHRIEYTDVVEIQR